MKTAAIIAARMGSTRLDRKAVLTLAGHPVVAHAIMRSKKFPGVSEEEGVVLAIPEGEKENELAEMGVEYGATVFRGDEDDVLSRVLLAAEAVDADVIWRVTGDNPLVDLGVVKATWDGFMSGEWDYAAMDDTPLGTTAELLTVDALRRAGEIADIPRLREHPTLAMYENSELFRMLLIPSPEKWRRPQWRLTIDGESDFRVVEKIMTELGIGAGLDEIVAYLDAHPEVALMNADVAQKDWEKLKERKDAIGHV